jgi:hypothetical protein
MHQDALNPFVIMHPTNELDDRACLNISHLHISVIADLADIVKLQPQHIQPTGLERGIRKVDISD